MMVFILLSKFKIYISNVWYTKHDIITMKNYWNAKKNQQQNQIIIIIIHTMGFEDVGETTKWNIENCRKWISVYKTLIEIHNLNDFEGEIFQ